jgi:E3 ubiquitin-protein ligase NRDP1
LTSNPAQFNTNSSFSDLESGFAYYGLGQLRNGSNASGSAYGKRFKKKGVLGVQLNLTKGTLSFSLNGESFGVAFMS